MDIGVHLIMVFLIICGMNLIKCYYRDFCVDISPEQVSLLLTFGGFELITEGFGIRVWGSRNNKTNKNRKG